MVLYQVRKENPNIGDTYQVYVVAADKKRAERAARMVYWHGEKCQLKTEEVDMTSESIVGAKDWYP